MWNMLTDWSTIFSVLTIVLCLLVTIFFLVRVKFEQIFWKLPSSNFPVIPNRSMKKVSNPFVALFDNLEATEIGDDVDVELTCKYPCHLTSLWAVDIDKLHEALLQPSHTLLLQLHHGEALQDTVQHIIEIPDLCEGKRLSLNCPSDVAELGLGTTPRSSYPLVLILSLPVGLSGLDITDSDVVLSVYILHLKDSKCSRSSHVIKHYIKLYNGNLLSLQPLFLSSCKADNTESLISKELMEDQSSGRDMYNQPTYVNVGNRTETVRFDNTISQPTVGCGPNDMTATSDEDLCCVVCQSLAISVVLLPCRHMCACEKCFVQLETCPMCRASITSYFRISDTDSEPSQWESLNNTINDYLGIQQQQHVH